MVGEPQGRQVDINRPYGERFTTKSTVRQGVVLVNGPSTKCPLVPVTLVHQLRTPLRP